MYALEKSTDHALKLAPLRRASVRTWATRVSRSCGQYVSVESAVEFTHERERSSMTRYLGSCKPCCSAMQNRGDITVVVMSEFVIGTGLDSQPLRCSFHDIPQHFSLMTFSLPFVIERKMFLFRRLNPVRRCLSFFDAIVFLAAITFELAIVPVISTPLVKSLGRDVSG